LPAAELPANPINYHAIRPKFSKNALLNALKLAETSQIGQIGSIDMLSFDGMA